MAALLLQRFGHSMSTIAQATYRYPASAGLVATELAKKALDYQANASSLVKLCGVELVHKGQNQFNMWPNADTLVSCAQQ